MLLSLRMLGEGQKSQQMQGHWVSAHSGKRVLRPGGRLEQEHRWAGHLHTELDSLGREWLIRGKLDQDEPIHSRTQ